jgi:hypothetical protein
VCHYWDEKVGRNFGIIASYSVLGLWLKLCNALADVWLLALVYHTWTNQLKNFHVHTYSIMYKFCPLTTYHLHYILHFFFVTSICKVGAAVSPEGNESFSEVEWGERADGDFMFLQQMKFAN